MFFRSGVRRRFVDSKISATFAPRWIHFFPPVDLRSLLSFVIGDVYLLTDSIFTSSSIVGSCMRDDIYILDLLYLLLDLNSNYMSLAMVY